VSENGTGVVGIEKWVVVVVSYRKETADGGAEC
jgi:hypothetical protein